MARPFSLQTVLDLMRNRNDQATQDLARLIAAERDGRKKLALLLQYRDEYAARFQQAAQEGLAQPAWRNYRDFLERLDDAIREQLQAVHQQATHTAAGQEDWQRQRSRLQAFATLAERHRASETQRESRQEQKTQDEFAARCNDHDQDP
jgi:flagellar FliJ protein